MSAETAEVSREQQLKERAERKSLWRAKLQVRKMKNLTDPTSIVIVPRSAGGHNLTKVLFGFDKVIHKMRVDGGLGGVKVGKVTEGIVMIQEFKGQLKELAGAITSMAKYPSNAMYDMHESPEHKKILAHTSGSYVIVPSTNDTKEIGQLIKRIEAALTVVKLTCSDYGQAAIAIDHVDKMALVFDELCEKLSHMSNGGYYTPKGMKPSVPGEPSVSAAA